MKKTLQEWLEIPFRRERSYGETITARLRGSRKANSLQGENRCSKIG